MNNRVKFYIPSHIESNKRWHLFPLLKPFFKDEGYSDSKRKMEYYISESDVNFTEDICQTDFVVLPMSWNFYLKNKQINLALKTIEYARKNNKTVLSFTNGDYGVAIPKLKNLIVFRSSGERSKLPNFHKGLPSFIEDPLKKHFNTESVFFRDYNSKPVIGFCGQTNSSFFNSIKEISRIIWHNLKYYLKIHDHLSQKIQSTSYLRSKVLTVIKKADNLQNNFIERKKYRAGAVTIEQRGKSTQEFYKNIKESDYIVCVRGAGNFSVRFYEALAMGRIPIFINTDCILPLVDKINWKKHVVWIEQNEMKSIEKKVLQFHNLLSAEDFNNLQLTNRKLWEESLTLGGFFKTKFNE